MPTPRPSTRPHTADWDATHPRSTDIRPATPADLDAIITMQREWSNQLGFLPTTALRAYVDRNVALIATHARQPVAYLVGKTALSSLPELATITQIAVTRAYHAQGLATQLLAAFAALPTIARQLGIQAICRADLPANRFWHRRSFRPICHLTPHNARRQPLIVWRLLLTPTAPLWFASPPPRAGSHGKRTTPPVRTHSLPSGHDPRKWLLP